MKNRLQFSVRTSVLKQFFLDVAIAYVYPHSPPDKENSERGSLRFPFVGGRMRGYT